MVQFEHICCVSLWFLFPFFLRGVFTGWRVFVLTFILFHNNFYGCCLLHCFLIHFKSLIFLTSDILSLYRKLWESYKVSSAPKDPCPAAIMKGSIFKFMVHCLKVRFLLPLILCFLYFWGTIYYFSLVFFFSPYR